MEQSTRAASLPTVTGHLDYYLQHGLNPVRYEMENLEWHLQRRGSLYRALGVPPLAIRNARVLEVAAGSGQNSLYIARLRPRELTLVEPNPAGLQDIKELYSRPDTASLRPHLVESRLQEYHPEGQFDLVICENWLGQSAAERALLRRLGQLVAPGGLLVLTTISPIGLLANVLRRALAWRLLPPNASFAEQTCLLLEAFGSHLATVPNMTRTCTDWIHDNLMNPHYFNILLTIPMVAEDLGQSFSFVGSSPDFAVDWRWFKSLYGPGRDFNGHFVTEYFANSHNFLDYRTVLPRREEAANRELERVAWQVVEVAAQLDQTPASDVALTAKRCGQLLDTLQAVQAKLVDLPAELAQSLRQFASLFARPEVSAAVVSRLAPFNAWFGRETTYVSLEKIG